MREKGNLLKLFLTFAKMGLVCFGGGWSMIAQVHEEFVVKQRALGEEDLNDLANLARSLPGIMVCNYGMLLGNRLNGVMGGIVCTLGMAIGPFCVLLIVTGAYVAFRDNLYVSAAMSGVRAAIVPIILSSLGFLRQGAFRFPPCYLVAVVCFALYFFFGFSTITLILAGAVCGLVISRIYSGEGKDAVS